RFNGNLRQSSDVELLFARHTRTRFEYEQVEDRAERHAVSEINQRKNSHSIAHGLVHVRQLESLPAKFFIGVVILISGLFLIFGAGRFFQVVFKTSPPKHANSADSSVIRMTRLTPDLNILSAGLSPDGKYLAYDLEENGRHSLWVKDIKSGGASRIGPPMDNPYFDVTYTPDGAYIYYNSLKTNHPNRTIFRVPAEGGDPQEIAYDDISPVTFSPDQQRIAFIRGRPGESSLIITDADGRGNDRELRSRRSGSWVEGGGSNLSWSPDGKRIAVCGANFSAGRDRYELTEVSVSDGSERVIPTRKWNYLDDVAWLSDQSGLIVRARETQTSPWQIWHVSYPDGETRRITNDLNDYDYLSVSANSRLLAVNM